jgi:hypothetical protein
MKYIKTYENKDVRTFKEWLFENPHGPYVEYINCGYSNLIDLNGIEEFINLKILDCDGNNLTELPNLSSLKKLSGIFCSRNNLTELPDLSNLKKLKTLYCYDNKLKKLPDLTGLEGLRDLYCFDNKLPFNCGKNNNLFEYLEWHKKEYPWIYDAKKYNL